MLKVLGATHIGKMRTENQDTFFGQVVSAELGYGCVCDGMGGENAGGCASAIAKQVLEDALRRAQWEQITDVNIKNLFDSSVATANLKIYDAAQEDESRKGMGTTVAMAVIMNNTLYCAHAGDSRVYSIKDGRLIRLTSDHTVVQLLIDTGELSEKAAQNHPQRHFITRALGVGNELDLEFNQFDLSDEECILLVTDGLYNSLSEEQIVAYTHLSIERQDATILVEAANEYGGSDNITAVILQR